MRRTPGGRGAQIRDGQTALNRARECPHGRDRSQALDALADAPPILPPFFAAGVGTSPHPPSLTGLRTKFPSDHKPRALHGLNSSSSRFATARIPAPTLGKPHHPCPSVRTRLMPPGRGNKEDNNGPGPERVIPRGPRPDSRGLRRPPRGLDPGRRAKTFVQKKSIEPVEYSFSRRYTGDSLYLPSETL